MKTIAKALSDEIAYPISEGYVENKLLARELDGECEVTAEILQSSEFRGAVADCLYALVESPNFSESDISFSLNDRNLILKKANTIYKEIGEPEKDLTIPKVYVGW